MRDTIKAENPDIKFTEITSLLGTKWNELPDEEKVTYKEQYEADKLRYETELVFFLYYFLIYFRMFLMKSTPRLNNGLQI